VYFISPSRDRLSYVLWIHFKASNNATEYEAALHDLRITVELSIKSSRFSVILLLSYTR
jgi:hypothetical protein